MKNFWVFTMIFFSVALVMSGCTSGSRLGEAGERGAREINRKSVEVDEVSDAVKGDGDSEEVGGGAWIDEDSSSGSGEGDNDALSAAMSSSSEGRSNDKTSNGTGVENQSSFDLSGVEISGVQLEIIRDGFLQLSDVYVSPSGLIYTVDAMRNYLYRLDPDTGVMDSLGGRGQGNTQFWGPISVHGANDLKIFVQDAGNGRIQMFDRRFQFLGSLAMEGGSILISESPSVGLSVNRAGGVVFWDEGDSKVVGSTSSYTIDNTFNPDVSQINIPPTKLRESPDGFIILDVQGQNIHRFAENGRYLGYLSGFGQILDVSITDNEWIILTSKHIISTSSSGQIIKVILHTIENPKNVTHHKNNLIVSTSTKLFKVII